MPLDVPIRRRYLTAASVKGKFRMTAVDLSLFPDDETTEAMVGGNPPKACFFCGEVLPAGPVVIWHGSHPEPRLQIGWLQIGLHPECAIQLAAHLGHDAVNARYHKTIDKTLSHRNE